ncbi:PilW family protein [Pseudomonas sp. KU43P]|uniref:PilW family protein n=1 Tax=Pseudomonas sp. KU43P TaxID=2487887 RepID=UPI0012A9A108|nr:prepilin-type N-terminal cleavage/methylation domain-containing protein [Pseudomonas sp. KU43P]BBH44175.1 pilus assembly protein PilW [Pseudomonas sp. KU43P]
MRRRQSGFGLLEATLALAIGLMVLAATSQLFASAHQSWRLQGAALRLQDDARLALLRMAQDIRLAGMFGCLRLKPGDFESPAARQVFTRPLDIGPSSLSLVAAELPGHTGPADWTLLTDCTCKAQVKNGRYPATDELMAIPISRIRYELSGTTLMFTRRNQRQSLVDHVRELQVALVQSPQGQRVDLQLTMYEPTFEIEQRHALSVALRNPVPGP